MEWFTNLAPHWMWLTLGAALGAAEVLVPGFFLIWLAVAAIITGLLAAVLPIGIFGQVMIFAILAVASVYAGRRWFAANPIVSSDPNLNNRGARMIGEIVTVVEAITNGHGRVKVGDSVWNARGSDVPVGANVRVTGADGSTLLVEAL
jgi:inner membrane protein